MIKAEMGVRYWKINGETNSYDSLHDFFIQCGMEEITPDGFKDEITGWPRKRMYTDGTITFTTEWFINLATLRFGGWDGSLCDISFDEIKGSFLPYSDHNTFRFLCGGKYVCNLALQKGGAYANTPGE